MKFPDVCFNLILASTALSDIDGISAAGATAQDRRRTPALDAEFLALKKIGPNCIPLSPLGICSPVVLTRAALSFVDHELKVFDVGASITPKCDLQTVHYKAVAKDCRQSPAMPFDLAFAIFDQGRRSGKSAQPQQQQVLAECVPGGTTTASLILESLNVSCEGLVSNSLPPQMQDLTILKNKVIEAALLRANKDCTSSTGQNLKERCQQEPLYAVAQNGDAFQAFAAGFIIGALENGVKSILLAGGAQMLAVYHLTASLKKAMPTQIKIDATDLSNRCLVATTPWIMHDRHSDIRTLATAVGATLHAEDFTLGSSVHKGLRAYEEGNVKEGVGAGGALYLAKNVARVDDATLLSQIESVYSLVL